MLQLTPDLSNRCRATLLRCSEFDSHKSLEAVFVTEELIPFRDRLPGEASKSDRVDQCLDFLRSQQLQDGRFVLLLFLEALRDRYDPHVMLHRELEIVKGELEILWRTQSRPETQPRYDLPQPWNFDLSELIKRCMNELIRRKSGLIGLGLPYENLKFLEYLCNRLENEWGRERFSYIYDSLKIDPLSLPVDRAVERVLKYTVNVNRGDVLFGIVVSEEAMKAFWHELSDKIKTKTLPHRLILILATNVADDFPKDVMPLPRPQFDFSDIHEWVKQIVESFQLPNIVVDPWRDLMIHECCEEGLLEIQAVYMQIEYMLKRLKHNPTVQCFQAELEERNLSYVQTSY